MARILQFVPKSVTERRKLEPTTISPRPVVQILARKAETLRRAA